MNRHFLIGILMLSFNLTSFAQQTHIDVAPSGKANYLPVQGGAIHMVIDSTTPLKNLIDRLSGDWQFIETFKMYWIGYTNDMFSIAARGDSAIGPLVRVVENSNNDHARIGAIYTIHLIGINREIVGRFMEKFVDTNARKALLYLLKYPNRQSTIMELLIRDPWQSDVGELIDCLKNSDSDCWAVVGGLNNYKLENAPLRQTIPDNLANIVLKLHFSNPSILERDFDFEGQTQEILDSIIRLKNDSIIVEKDLLNRPLRGNWRSKVGHGAPGDHYLELSVGQFLDPFGSSFVNGVGDKFQYYVETNKLYICSASTAKKRWIDWWANQKARQ